MRCDLGSVDNPHDPPCVRCRRESKECYFSATRRKKRNEAESGDVGTDEDGLYEIKNKKRVKITQQNDGPYDDEEVDRPLTPGGGLAQTQPLRRPQAQKPQQFGEEDIKASEAVAASLQIREVHGGHDALKLLSDVAQMRDRMNSKELMEQQPGFNGVSPVSLPSATSPTMDRGGPRSYGASINADSESKDRPAFDIAAYNRAIKAWSRHRFVRAGWFTPREAIDYVSYFYKYLSPLTPVALPDFRAHEYHEKMLTEEPMLTVTILLVASRHMKLVGPGAASRPHSIHDKLWKYLSGMVNRVVWGQEQFGGGFCGAGAEPGSDVNPLERKGLRTLGTVESLVLLTEWHPRAMHFPPDEADEELMVPDQPVSTPEYVSENDLPNGIGGHRMDAWLEPCWRSDRMCWMLLGMAMSLSFEIGVFDSSDWQRHASNMDGQPLSALDLGAYDRRRGNVRDLLLVYVTQTSGRLGLTSMLPASYSKPEDSALYIRSTHSSIQETVLHFWLRLAAIMREGNQKIFANKAFTRDLIKNGDYKAALDRHQEPLLKWREEFEACLAIPKYMRHILEIEYEYCRVYVNALALQAVAERCANEDPMAQVLDPPFEMARTVAQNGVPVKDAINPQTLGRWLGGDRKYLVTVGDAARNLLKAVVDGLYPGEYLKHAPVRTYFRIISVAIMLLKSFSLGASESDVADSLNLMDRTVEALTTCVVDDVHVASRFAELLDKLTQSLRPRLVRITADGRASRSQRVSHTDSLTPGPSGPVAAGPTMHAQPMQQQSQAIAGSLPNQQQWTYNYPNGGNTPSNNPLFGISTDSYDLAGSDYMVMPPPGFNVNSPDASNPMAAGNAPNGGYEAYSANNPNAFGLGGQDWLTLPLDNLLNIAPGAEVNQTMYGPQIGGTDMLEMLLRDSDIQNGGNGFS